VIRASRGPTGHSSSVVRTERTYVEVRCLAPEVSSRVRQASEEVETSGFSPRCLGHLVFCSRGEQRYSGRYVSRRTLVCLSVVSAMVSGGHLPCK
jgi:hypothetical protein